jgi:DNA polymerase I-like protein with 3'-5' exonuclease and polymerase domains
MNVLTVTPEEMSRLSEKLEAVDEIGLDYETTSEFPGQWSTVQFDKLKSVGWGFGFPDGTCTYVPVGHVHSRNVDFNDAYSQLQKVLEDPTKIVTCHHAKFEQRVTRVLRINAKCQWRCSMLAQWLLNKGLPGAKGHRLKPAVKHYLKHTMTEWGEVVPSNMRAHMIRSQTMAPYCADDALQGLRLGQKFLEEIKELRMEKVYLELEMPFVEVLTHMDEVGFAIDPKYLMRLWEEYREEMRRLAIKFSELTNVDVASSQAISSAMFDKKKWWPIPRWFSRGKSGFYSIDKKHRESVRLMLKKGSLGYKAMELKDRYQEIQKLVSTYTISFVNASKLYKDKRVRSDWKQHGTSTGRLSCIAPWVRVATDLGMMSISDLYFLQKCRDWYTFTHKIRWRKIDSVFIKGYSEMFEVVLGNGSIIHCTKSHIFNTPNGWVSLKDLGIYDEVEVFNHSFGVDYFTFSRTDGIYDKGFYTPSLVSTSRIVSIERCGSFPVYDLSVEEDHSYIAQGFINHNSSAPNIQNLPMRSDEGRKVRAGMVSEEGWTLVDPDYSQADLRMMAHLSGDPMLMKAYNEDIDLHQQTAVTCHCDRPTGKVVNLGLIYEMSAYTLANNLGISDARGKILWDRWHSVYPLVRKYQERMHEYARRNGFVRTMTGRIRLIPDINSYSRGKRRFAERTASNTPDQGSVADMIKIAMRNVYREWKERGVLYDWYTQEGKVKMVSQVHDEIICEALDDFAEEAGDDLKRHMENAVKLRVPFRADPGFGKNWLEAHQ